MGFKNVALLALAAASVVKADAPVTTDLFLVGFSQMPLVASVVTSDATATTFSIACASSASACSVPTSFTFTQGPSTIHYSYSHTATASDDPNGVMEVGCTITSDHGTCSKSINAVLGTITSASTSAQTTFTNGGSELGGQEVTITAGHLVTPTTASSTATITSASSSSNASFNSTSLVANVTSSTASFSNTTLALSTSAKPKVTTSTQLTSAKTTAQKTSSSTGGMPMITGNAQWVVGGVAAALMAVAL